MNNLSVLAGWAAPWVPRAPLIGSPGLACPKQHMAAPDVRASICAQLIKNQQQPAPRGLGCPQIGHLELEGKTNHGELWDTCLSSAAGLKKWYRRCGFWKGEPGRLVDLRRDALVILWIPPSFYSPCLAHSLAQDTPLSLMGPSHPW